MGFQSIIVLDFETTCLTRTKVTELCMVACEKSHLIDSRDIPRVLHKVSFCVNPCIKINPSTSAITGLDNELLENVQPFNEEKLECIKNLIAHVPGPVCLIAHNGMNFDFPILHREIKKIASLAIEDISVADSLTFFKMYYNRKRPLVPTPGPAIHPDLLDLEEDKFCNEAFELVMREFELHKITQDNQESTPNKPTQSAAVTPLKNPDTRRDSHTATKARRTLEFEPSSQDSINSQSSQPAIPISPKSLKLGDIFEFFMKRPMPSAHQAETDCMALLKCISQVPEEFFGFIDHNSVLLSTVSTFRS